MIFVVRSKEHADAFQRAYNLDYDVHQSRVRAQHAQHACDLAQSRAELKVSPRGRAFHLVTSLSSCTAQGTTAVVEDKDKQIAELKAKAAAKDATIAEKEQTIKDKDGDIKADNGPVPDSHLLFAQKLNKAVADLVAVKEVKPSVDACLSHANPLAQGTTAVVEDKDKQIAELKAKAAAKDATIAEKEQTIKDKDGDIKADNGPVPDSHLLFAQKLNKAVADLVAVKEVKPSVDACLLCHAHPLLICQAGKKASDSRLAETSGQFARQVTASNTFKCCSESSSSTNVSQSLQEELRKIAKERAEMKAETDAREQQVRLVLIASSCFELRSWHSCAGTKTRLRSSATKRSRTVTRPSGTARRARSLFIRPINSTSLCQHLKQECDRIAGIAKSDKQRLGSDLEKSRIRLAAAEEDAKVPAALRPLLFLCSARFLARCPPCSPGEFVVLLCRKCQRSTRAFARTRTASRYGTGCASNTSGCASNTYVCLVAERQVADRQAAEGLNCSRPCAWSCAMLFAQDTAEMSSRKDQELLRTREEGRKEIKVPQCPFVDPLRKLTDAASQLLTQQVEALKLQLAAEHAENQSNAVKLSEFKQVCLTTFSCNFAATARNWPRSTLAL